MSGGFPANRTHGSHRDQAKPKHSLPLLQARHSDLLLWLFVKYATNVIYHSSIYLTVWLGTCGHSGRACVTVTHSLSTAIFTDLSKALDQADRNILLKLQPLDVDDVAFHWCHRGEFTSLLILLLYHTSIYLFLLITTSMSIFMPMMHLWMHFSPNTYG